VNVKQAQRIGRIVIIVIRHVTDILRLLLRQCLCTVLGGAVETTICFHPAEEKEHNHDVENSYSEIVPVLGYWSECKHLTFIHSTCMRTRIKINYPDGRQVYCKYV